MGGEMIGLPQGIYWLLAVCIALLSLGVSVATFRRAGDWRRTEAGKAAQNSIASTEGRVKTLETQTEGLPGKIEAVNERLRVVETNLTHIPTKSEFSRLSAEVEATQRDVGLIRGGVTRIEDFLMRMSKP